VLTTFQFLEAKHLVNRVKANPRILLAHNIALNEGGLARYNLTRVELKNFTFSSGSQSLSFDHAVLGTIPKRLLFTIVRNKDFLGSMDSNPYRFQHFNIKAFAMYVNGKQIPSERLSLDMSREKSSVMGCRTFFEGCAIHHSHSGRQITYEMYRNGFFMLLFHLTWPHQKDIRQILTMVIFI